MNSGIAQAFERCRQNGELALIPYLTAGFPSMHAFREQLRRVADCGADLIEIGVPFCDPIADGPTIQQSSQAALAAGASLRAIFSALRSFDLGRPLIFMSYLNPLLAFGRERLLVEMNDTRVRGLIVADLPVEEAADWRQAAREARVDLILLAAPTSPAERLRQIGAASSGFVYAVSRTGTTGAHAQMQSGLPDFLKRLRAATALPVAVGFGISTPEHVHALRGQADGAVVGSRLVDAIRNGDDVGALLRQLKAACCA